MKNNQSLKVLVIGGAGYIGSHVTKELLKAGHQPTVFDNLSLGLRENLFPDVPFIHGDIMIREQINAASTGMDAIIHLAALKAAGESMVEPEKYSSRNLTGTINIINAASLAGIKKIVFSSTAAVYGDPQYTPMDEKHPTDPMNFYGFTKLEIERILRWYDQLRGIKSVCLRYFNAAGYDVDGEICGLEQGPQNLFPIIMEAVMGMRSHVSVFGDDFDTEDGTGVRDYVHVSDLADAHVRALNLLIEKKQSDVINLGTAKGLSVNKAIQKTKELSEVDFEVKVVGRRAGDPPTVLADPSKAKEVLGWEAKHSDVETIIQTMLHAYRKALGKSK